MFYEIGFAILMVAMCMFAIPTILGMRHLLKVFQDGWGKTLAVHAATLPAMWLGAQAATLSFFAVAYINPTVGGVGLLWLSLLAADVLRLKLGQKLPRTLTVATAAVVLFAGLCLVRAVGVRADAKVLLAERPWAAIAIAELRGQSPHQQIEDAMTEAFPQQYATIVARTIDEVDAEGPAARTTSRLGRRIQDGVTHWLKSQNTLLARAPDAELVSFARNWADVVSAVAAPEAQCRLRQDGTVTLAPAYRDKAASADMLAQTGEMVASNVHALRGAIDHPVVRRFPPERVATLNGLFRATLPADLQDALAHNRATESQMCEVVLVRWPRWVATLSEADIALVVAEGAGGLQAR